LFALNQLSILFQWQSKVVVQHVEQLGGFEPWESSHIPRNIEDEYYSFFKYIGEKIENIC
jgi:hypothetical protein